MGMDWRDPSISMNQADMDEYEGELSHVRVSENRILVKYTDSKHIDRIAREMGDDIFLTEARWKDIKHVDITTDDLYYPHIDIMVRQRDGRSIEKRIYFIEDEFETLKDCARSIQKFWMAWRQNQIQARPAPGKDTAEPEPDDGPEDDETVQLEAEEQVEHDDGGPSAPDEAVEPETEPAPEPEPETPPSDQEVIDAVTAEKEASPHGTASEEIVETPEEDAEDRVAMAHEARDHPFEDWDMYREIVTRPVAEVKEAATARDDLDFGKLLAAERAHKDRASMREWIKHRIRDRNIPDEIIEMPIADVKKAVNDHDADPADLIPVERDRLARKSLLKWLGDQEKRPRASERDTEKTSSKTTDAGDADAQKDESDESGWSGLSVTRADESAEQPPEPERESSAETRPHRSEQDTDSAARSKLQKLPEQETAAQTGDETTGQGRTASTTTPETEESDDHEPSESAKKLARARRAQEQKDRESGTSADDEDDDDDDSVNDVVSDYLGD